MFGFDIYNFYSIAPSVGVVVAMIVMVGFGIRFLRQEIIKDAAKAQK